MNNTPLTSNILNALKDPQNPFRELKPFVFKTKHKIFCVLHKNLSDAYRHDHVQEREKQ